MSRSAYSRCCVTSYPDPLGYLYAFHPATSASAAISAAAASSTRRKLAQEVAVAAHGDVPVRLALDPFAPAPSHLGEVVLAVVHVADRTREELGTSRRHHDPTA